MRQVTQPPAPAVQKAIVGDAQTIKVDIKATHDATTPVELLVEPAEKGAGEAHGRPAAAPSVASPALAPLPEAHERVSQPEVQAPAPQPEVPALAPQPEEAPQPVQKEVRPAPLSSLPQDGPNIHADHCGTSSRAASKSAVLLFPPTTPCSRQNAPNPFSEACSCTATPWSWLMLMSDFLCRCLLRQLPALQLSPRSRTLPRPTDCVTCLFRLRLRRLPMSAALPRLSA